MNLEQQVCSLELAKKLKELGVKQESLFTWSREEPTVPYRLVYGVAQPWQTADEEHAYSAFTVAELGEMLPSSIHHGNLQLWKTRKGWTMAYYPHHKMTADTEADARAKMLVYLLENKLLTL